MSCGKDRNCLNGSSVECSSWVWARPTTPSGTVAPQLMRQNVWNVHRIEIKSIISHNWWFNSLNEYNLQINWKRWFSEKRLRRRRWRRRSKEVFFSRNFKSKISIESNLLWLTRQIYIRKDTKKHLSIDRIERRWEEKRVARWGWPFLVLCVLFSSARSFFRTCLSFLESAFRFVRFVWYFFSCFFVVTLVWANNRRGPLFVWFNNENNQTKDQSTVTIYINHS